MDYVLWVEIVVVLLKLVDEIVSDSFLIVMVLKGLFEEYKMFLVIVLQCDEKEDKMKF